MQRFSPKASSVMEKKIFKGFYHIWAWRPSWSMDRHHFSNLSFLHPEEAPYEIWAKLAQRLQRRSCLKMLTDGCTHGLTDRRTDDGLKVITIAHPEQSSGELKNDKNKFKILSNHLCFCRPRRKWQSFRKTSLKLYEKYSTAQVFFQEHDHLNKLSITF